MVTPGKSPPVSVIPVEEEAGEVGHKELGIRRAGLRERRALKSFVAKINHADIEVAVTLAGEDNGIGALREIQQLFCREDRVAALVVDQHKTDT